MDWGCGIGAEARNHTSNLHATNTHCLREEALYPLLDEGHAEDAIDGGPLAGVVPQARVDQPAQLTAVARRQGRVGASEEEG